MKNRIKTENNANYFKNFKLALWVLGISLEERETLGYKIYSFTIISSCLVYGAICFNEIFKRDFDTLINTLLYQFAVFIAITKTMVVLQKRSQVGNILKTLEQKPFVPNPERGGNLEEKLINECLWITNFQNKTYWGATIASIIVSLGTVIRKRLSSDDYRDWEFPYGPIETFNATYTPNYEIILSYQIISMTCFAVYFSVTDLTAAAVLAQVTYQFKILQNNIKNILKLSYKDMLKNSTCLMIDDIDCSHIDASLIPWKYLKKSLADVIEYHLAIISIVDELEDVFSGLFLVVFVSNLGLIALMVYHLSLMSFHDTHTYTAAAELVCATVQTLVVCYWGEQVLYESQLVGNSVFESNFFGADVRFQKGLILIIRRSQLPVAVTAKKFTIIGMSTFAWILQKSYAAYMVLRNTKATEI